MAWLGRPGKRVTDACNVFCVQTDDLVHYSQNRSR
jgi:hypothetical protein